MSSKIAKASLSEEGYILLEYFQEDVTLSKPEVEFGWTQAAIIDPLKKNPVFLVTAPWSLLNDEARIFVMKEMQSWPQVAVVVHNLAQKLMGNFALKISGRSKQIKIFDDIESAKNWLVCPVKINS